MKTLLTLIAALLLMTGTANAASTRATVEYEGSYSYPCVKRGQVCSHGIVVLYVNGFYVSDHVIRCPRPRRLRVLGIQNGRVNVFACSRYYHWSVAG